VSTTRTHVYVTFADPFLDCLKCGQPVDAWHNAQACGCDSADWNVPCEHRAGIDGVCPSWGPVDGCRCAEVLGSVDHRPAIAKEDQ
jgi:hypothetical protein